MRRRIIFIINMTLRRVGIGIVIGIGLDEAGGRKVELPGISHEFMTF